MVKSWVIQMAISFVMRQLGKWQTGVDWAKVKADLTERIKALIPGEWFDSEVVAVCMAVVDAVAAALQATDALEKIVKLVVDGKIEEAWVLLRKLILGNWAPVSLAEQKVYASVDGCESIEA